MNKEIYWDEEMEIAYGVKSEFENEIDFKNHVKCDYLNLVEHECIVGNVRTELCIYTNNGIGVEQITPISETDIEIMNYYIVDVEEKED